LKRSDFLANFDFVGYVMTHFSPIMETSNEDRIRTLCPICDDKNGHLYILLSEGLAYCQRCKYDPKSPIRFISDVEGITQQAVVGMAGDGWSYVDTSVEEVVEGLFEEHEDVFSYEIIGLESTFFPVLEDIGIFPLNQAVIKARDYLEARGVTPSQMATYDIRYCYDGQYAGRVIVPCFFKGDVVTFVARDIFGMSSRKYLNPPGNKQSDFLFNLDRILGDTVVLTEGVFDAISSSEAAPSVASFGKSLSKRQIELLNRFKRVTFYWDKDAYPQVESYASKLQGECRVVLHSDGRDAGDRTPEENSRLIKSSALIGSVEYEMFKLTQLNS
jgi:DNA primase